MAHKCNCCNGEGYVPCRRCGGVGTFESHGLFKQEETCPACDGRRYVGCPACNGRGEVED